jgi:S1-C subfamily serine protease
VTGDTLDLVLLGAVALFAVSGYRQGFAVGVLSFLGFLGGGVLGARLAEPLARLVVGPGGHAPLLGVVFVFAFAALGQVVAAGIGRAFRRRLVWQPARAVDSIAGAAVSAVSVLLVAWLLGTAVARSPFEGLARQVRRSAVLTTIDSLMPDQARAWFASFRRLVDNNGFPEVFGGIAPERVRPVAPPDPALVGSRAVRTDRPSIVKVIGVADACSRQVEGSGFVYAPQRVMTNAHVVAGVRDPRVEVGDSSFAAVVVLYDPERDVAVLHVPGLTEQPLAFAPVAPSSTDAIVAGYPQNGPFTVVPARIRNVLNAHGPDIYSQNEVTREVYALRATVRPGNSGGPLLAVDGRVYGVVFAAARDDPNTGYALTAAEVASDARAGAQRSAQVTTMGCD